VQYDEPMAPTAARIATCDKWFHPTTCLGQSLPWTTQGRGNAHANHKETQEQKVENSPNPQGRSNGTNPKDQSTWLLYFSEFNSWLGFTAGVQEIFILETSLLVGLGPFKEAQLKIHVWSNLHLNRHNSLLRDPIDVLFIAYESRLQELFIHI
jgi:hypothetical protein